MTDYLRQTKSNIEEKMRDEECDNTSDCESDTPPVNFIIDNFKGTQNTFNVILAQRENDLQRITQLSIRNEKQRSEIDKLDTQKYQFCLDNANLRLEIEEIKTKTAASKKLSACQLVRSRTIAGVSIIVNCIMLAVLTQW